MRKIVLFILALATLVSCSNDDDATTDQIIGEWKLIRAEFYGLEGGNWGSIDYTSENINYRFKPNGKLSVTGGENAGFWTGEYEYYFGEDHLGGSMDPKVLLVRINNSKWTYHFTDGEMKLGQSYVDGPDLVFVRI